MTVTYIKITKEAHMEMETKIKSALIGNRWV